jgi:hypothetical protein
LPVGLLDKVFTNGDNFTAQHNSTPHGDEITQDFRETTQDIGGQMTVKAVLLAALLALGPAAVCMGQTPIPEAPTASGETGLFDLLTGETLPRGSWSFSLFYNNRDRLIDLEDAFYGDADDLEVEWNRTSAAVGYGITDRWEVAVQVPFYESFNFHHEEQFFGDTLDRSGPNNIRVGTNFQLFRNVDRNTAISVSGYVEPPTSDSDVAVEDTGFGFKGAAHVRDMVFNFGYRQPGDEENFDIPEEIHGGAGYVRRINEQFQWMSEIDYTLLTGGDADDTEARDALDLTTGGRLWFGGPNGRWAANFGVRFNLIGLSGVGAVAGLTFGAR